MEYDKIRTGFWPPPLRTINAASSLEYSSLGEESVLIGGIND